MDREGFLCKIGVLLIRLSKFLDGSCLGMFEYEIRKIYVTDQKIIEWCMFDGNVNFGIKYGDFVQGNVNVYRRYVSKYIKVCNILTFCNEF